MAFGSPLTAFSTEILRGAMPQAPMKLPHPLIVAHRGFSSRYPENTLASFAGALETGAAMVELDVTLTADRQVVVIHDDTLDRTTAGRGQVHDITLEELKRLDAGSWFDARFCDERVPTLEEVVSLVDGRAYINIEIKELPRGSVHPAGLLEREVVETARRAGLDERALISSFSRSALETIRSLDPGLALAFLTRDPGDLSVLSFCRDLKTLSVHPRSRALKKQIVDRFHAAGILVIPYTVNRMDEFRRLLEMGADGVFTDHPDLFLAL